MPKRNFHNLDGLIRDLVAAFTSEGNDEAWERLVHFARIIGDVLDVLDDDSYLPDAADGTGRESDHGLDLRDRGDGSTMVRPDEGHDPVRPAPMAGPTGMDPEVGYARATQLAHGVVRSRPGALVRTRMVGG